MNRFGVDLIRTLGVLYIVGFWHLMDYAPGFGGYKNPLTYGSTVLVLASFTMLSGYLLGLKRVETSRADLIGFYRRRLVRIWPPMVVALLLFAALRIIDPIAAAKGISLLGAVVPPAPPTIWYVSMIVLFYVAAPFLIRAAAELGPIRYGLIGAALTAAMLLLHLATGLMDPRTVLYFPCFVLGVALAGTPVTMSAKRFGLLAAAALAGYAFCWVFPMSTWETNIASMPFALFGAWLVLSAAIVARPPVSPVVARVLAEISYASLFMYLFHRVVYKILKFVSPVHDPLAGLAVMLLIGLPLVVLASWWGQRFYDLSVVPRLNPSPAERRRAD